MHSLKNRRFSGFIIYYYDIDAIIQLKTESSKTLVVENVNFLNITHIELSIIVTGMTWYTYDELVIF